MCRVKIENSFALLKSRFRQLTRLDFRTVKRICKFIVACCTLHNLCIDCDDNIENFMETDIQTDIHLEDTDNNSRTEGEEKRNMLCDLLRCFSFVIIIFYLL